MYIRVDTRARHSDGNLAERAMTFAALVFGGVMDACPELKIFLAHGGGYTCYGNGMVYATNTP
jgi:hypothetical protein